MVHISYYFNWEKPVRLKSRPSIPKGQQNESISRDLAIIDAREGQMLLRNFPPV